MTKPSKSKGDGWAEKIWPPLIVALIISGIVTPIATLIVSGKLAEQAEFRAEERKREELRQAREHDRQELAQEKKRIYLQVQSAVEQYANSLGLLIGKAKGEVDDNLSAERIEVSARAFVGARNDLRDTLTSLSGSLNHEVDDLEDAIKDLEKNPDDKAAQDRVRKAILVVAQKWPVKADAIKVQIRKMLAELGLERILRGE